MIEEKLVTLKQKIKENVHSPENPQGLLWGKLTDYEDCLGLQREKLDKMF